MRTFLLGLGIGGVLAGGAMVWSRGGTAETVPPTEAVGSAATADAVSERLDARLARIERWMQAQSDAGGTTRADGRPDAPGAAASAAPPLASAGAPAGAASGPAEPSPAPPATESTPVEPSAAFVEVVLEAMERAEVRREQRRDPADALRSALRRRDEEKDPASAVKLLQGLLARTDVPDAVRRDARLELALAQRYSKDVAGAERTLAALIGETPTNDARRDAMRNQQAWNLDALGRTADALALADDCTRTASNDEGRWQAMYVVALLARKAGDAARAQAAFDAIRRASAGNGAALQYFNDLVGLGFVAR
ncbi:MAG: hypothetical protein JNM10_10955 [Planctomycetia bacterium]|nr:hypothetical protein [Planctomycetia bacterium]